MLQFFFLPVIHPLTASNCLNLIPVHCIWCTESVIWWAQSPTKLLHSWSFCGKKREDLIGEVKKNFTVYTTEVLTVLSARYPRSFHRMTMILMLICCGLHMLGIPEFCEALMHVLYSSQGYIHSITSSWLLESFHSPGATSIIPCPNFQCPCCHLMLVLLHCTLF